MFRADQANRRQERSTSLMRRSHRFPRPALLLLLGAAGLVFHAPAGGTESVQSTLGDVSYKPFGAKPGFTQAWNISFRGSGHYVVMTYIVSNIGPGDFNNGAALFLTNGSVARAGTAEFARADLKATPGQLNMTFGRGNHLRYERGRYIAEALVDDTSVHLELVPGGAGIRFSGGRFPVRGDGAFIQVDVPVLFASTTGSVTIAGQTTSLKGVAGIEHILTNESPEGYAKQFELTRTFSYKQGIAVGGLHGSRKQPDEFRGGVTLGGRVIFLRPVERREILGKSRDRMSGYSFPTTVVYHLKGPGGCSISVERQGFLGGFDVLRKVSAVLRWVLKTFFAKPYILHYRSTVKLACQQPEAAGMPKEGITLPAETSFYPIND